MSYSMKKDWRDSIKVGDILLEDGDPQRPRVVRSASYKRGFLGCVTFTILHCSWTGRCYTVVNRSDLAWRKFTPSGKKKRLLGKLNHKIKKAIESKERTLSCCDVEGIR